jgi:hypothetical protein
MRGKKRSPVAKDGDNELAVVLYITCQSDLNTGAIADGLKLQMDQKRLFEALLSRMKSTNH